MKVLIIEDEIIAAKRLSNLLQEIDPSIIIMQIIGAVVEAVNYLQEVEVDLIFMDIQLSDGDCFEIFEQIKILTPIVFITAYDEYMQQAFKVNSIDYLLKPIDKKELANSLNQFVKYRAVNSHVDNGIQQFVNDILATNKSLKRRFLVHQGKGFVSIDVIEISYIRSENKLTYLVLDDGKRYVVDYTLDKIFEMLDPLEFYKINRNYIVSCKSIIKMHPYFNNRMLLVLNPETKDDVLVSRSYLPDFRKWVDM
jgi:DNA-binding LytR/AlgR family response regulator